MNKILLILCTFFYLFSLNAYAEVVNKIIISGNKESDETLKCWAIFLINQK